MESLRQQVYSRELSWTELISIGTQLYKQNFKTIAWGVLLICLPIGFLQALFQLRFVQINMDALTITTMEEATAYLTQTLSLDLILLAISTFLVPIFTIGIAKSVKYCLEGMPVNVKSVFSKAILLEPVVVKVGIVYFIVLTISSMLIFPGIFFSVSWCLYIYAIAVGNRRGLDALGRSHVLVRNRWWKTFGLILVVGIIEISLSSAISMVLFQISDSFIMNIVSNALVYLCNGWSICVLTILFLNRESGLFGMSYLQEHYFDKTI